MIIFQIQRRLIWIKLLYCAKSGDIKGLPSAVQIIDENRYDSSVQYHVPRFLTSFAEKLLCEKFVSCSRNEVFRFVHETSAHETSF